MKSSAFWLKQRGDKKWMTIQFHCTYFARFIMGGCAERTGDECSLELRVEPVAAPY